MNKKTKTSKGFTLIEIMVAMVIIGIMAAVVLMQMQGYAKDARASKALGAISSVLPSIYSCWGNGGIVYSPVLGPDNELLGNQEICSLNTSYGYWPKSAGDLKNYYYSGNLFEGTENSDKNFHVLFFNSSDDKFVCCNSVMKSCKIMSSTDTACGGGAGCNKTCPSN